MDEVVTRSRFDAFRAEATDLILRAYEHADGMMSTFLFEDKDGDKASFCVPEFMMVNQMAKGVLSLVIRQQIKDKGFQIVCFCTEAWALAVEQSEGIPQHAPSEDPRRFEIIMLHFETKNFKHSTQFKLERESKDPESKVIAIHPYQDKDLTNIQIGGNFVGFFEEATF